METRILRFHRVMKNISLVLFNPFLTFLRCVFSKRKQKKKKKKKGQILAPPLEHQTMTVEFVRNPSIHF